jgi:hypothetical protein
VGAEVTAVVDAAGDVGRFPSIAVDPVSGAVLVSYWEAEVGELRLATRAPAGGWTTETVDPGPGVGAWSSLALDPASGEPRIAYHDAASRRLELAVRTAGTWTTGVVDPPASDSETVGTYASLVLDPLSGEPRVSYGWVNADPGAASSCLRIARRSGGGSWSHEDVACDASAQTTMGVSTALAAEPVTGLLRVAFASQSLSGDDGLHYCEEVPAEGGPASWSCTLSIAASTGIRGIAMVLDSSADWMPRALFYDEVGPGSLNLAHRDVDGWQLDRLAFVGTAGDGRTSSAAFDPATRTLVAAVYQSDPGLLLGLTVSVAPDSIGVGANPLDDDCGVGAYPSLALAPDGSTAWVAHYDTGRKALRVTRWELR